MLYCFERDMYIKGENYNINITFEDYFEQYRCIISVKHIYNSNDKKDKYNKLKL